MADSDLIDAFIAIGQVKARYCRCLDTKDWAGFADVFTEDLVLDVSDGTGVAPIHGREAALAMVKASLDGARTAHQVHNPEIDLHGDEAHVIWAMQDRVVWDPPKRGMAGLTGYGHYRERYVRRDGSWKIAATKLTRLHIDFQRAAAT